jgi:hypothetical protein
MLIVVGLDSFDSDYYRSVSTQQIDSLAERGHLEPFEELGPNELYTPILWPSILAGEHPHTLFPEYYEDSDDTPENKRSAYFERLLDSRIFQIPHDMAARNLSASQKDRLYKYLDRAGIERNTTKIDTIAEEAFQFYQPVFSKSESYNLISLPGYNEDKNNKKLKQMMENPTAENGDFSVSSDATTFERLAAKDDMDRLIRLLQSIQSRKYDFIFTHFFGLDPIQHVWRTDSEMMERWYLLYDNFVRQIMNELGDDDTLVVLSDHGMEAEGVHSRRAFYASTKELWPAETRSMIDVKDVLQEELENHIGESSTDEITDPTLSEASREHLEDLGYFSE